MSEVDHLTPDLHLKQILPTGNHYITVYLLPIFNRLAFKSSVGFLIWLLFDFTPIPKLCMLRTPDVPAGHLAPTEPNPSTLRDLKSTDNFFLLQLNCCSLTHKPLKLKLIEASNIILMTEAWMAGYRTTSAGSIYRTIRLNRRGGRCLPARLSPSKTTGLFNPWAPALYSATLASRPRRVHLYLAANLNKLDASRVTQPSIFFFSLPYL